MHDFLSQNIQYYSSTKKKKKKQQQQQTMLIRKSQINSFKSRVRIFAQSYKIVYGCCHWRLIHTFRTNKLNANWFLDSSITRLKYSMPLVLMQWCTSKLEETQEKKKKKKTF